jgi:hypothetical protein
MVHYIQTTPLSRVKVSLKAIALQKTTLWKSTMDEHFGSKARKPIGQV